MLAGLPATTCLSAALAEPTNTSEDKITAFAAAAAASFRQADGYGHGHGHGHSYTLGDGLKPCGYPGPLATDGANTHAVEHDVELVHAAGRTLQCAKMKSNGRQEPKSPKGCER